MSSNFARGLTSLALSLPVAVWTTDNLYSFAKVRGTSMEPALKDGDIVVLRKSDFCPGLAAADQDKETDRARHLRIEAGVGSTPATLWSKPPLTLEGHVVVFRSPNEAFANKYEIKRVVALGGQMMRPTKRFRQIEFIPQYSIWAEGDNGVPNSDDSNTYGPVSKKLIEGIVDRIIWPPSRWSAIETKIRSPDQAWWP